MLHVYSLNEYKACVIQFLIQYSKVYQSGLKVSCKIGKSFML